MTGFFIALCAAVSVASALVAIYAARIARAAPESLVRRLRSLESATESLSNSLTDNSETLSQLANRVKMMRVRTAVNHTKDVDGKPDPYSNPDAWRIAMNKQLGMRINERS